MHIKRFKEINENVLTDIKNELFPKHDKFGKAILLSVEENRYELIEQDIYPTDPKDFDTSTGSCKFRIFTKRINSGGTGVFTNERIVRIVKTYSTRSTPGLSISVSNGFGQSGDDGSMKLEISQGIIKRILKNIKSDLDPANIVKKKEEENDAELGNKFKGFPTRKKPNSFLGSIGLGGGDIKP